MKYIILSLLTIALLSCERSRSTAELTGYLQHSREHLIEMAYMAGWTHRDARLIEEYDELAALAGSTELVASIQNAEYLKPEQKKALLILSKSAYEANLVKLALINSYTANLHDYRFPIDVCHASLTSDGVVKVLFVSSAIRRIVYFSKSKEDLKSGNLTEIDLPHNASEVRLPNLQEGDSIYGYFSLSYLGGEYAKSEFSGKYIGESR